MVVVCVESGVGAHIDDAALAWAYDPPWWGLCGQGTDVDSALLDLRGRAAWEYATFLARNGEHAPALDGVEVAEQVHGDERAFALDREPATTDELERTVTILRWARAELEELLAGCTAAELDWDDPDRQMPSWARWRTLRQMGWHIADTESRYYLAALGVRPPERSADLTDELRQSHQHVLRALPQLRRGLAVATADGATWTTRKVLRRLAWHERSELDAMRRLRVRARRAVAEG